MHAAMKTQSIQSNMPRTSMEAHAESMVGRTIIQINSQLDTLNIALMTLRDRLDPVSVPMGELISNGASQSEVELHSPVSNDLQILYNRVSSQVDQVHTMLRGLNI